jgi:putative transposase
MTRIGTKKTYFLIKSELDRIGVRCGRDKLNAILKSEGMLIKKKKNYMRTTNSYHKF